MSTVLVNAIVVVPESSPINEKCERGDNTGQLVGNPYLIALRQSCSSLGP